MKVHFYVVAGLLSVGGMAQDVVAQPPCQTLPGAIVVRPGPVVVRNGQVITLTEARQANGAANATTSADEFRKAMRKLWEDHVVLTRKYVLSAVDGLPDKDANAKNLLQNQLDIGNAVKPYYGDAAGDKLAALLKDHILIAVELIDAAKAGDNAKKDDATKRWQANADEIAVFLAKANPKNWPESEMKSMMREHLDLTTEEVVARLKKDSSGDAAAYEKVHKQILHMADMLSSGIISQFPEKFTK